MKKRITVKIKTFKRMPKHWDSKMMKYCGKIINVTPDPEEGIYWGGYWAYKRRDFTIITKPLRTTGAT